MPGPPGFRAIYTELVRLYGRRRRRGGSSRPYNQGNYLFDGNLVLVIQQEQL